MQVKKLFSKLPRCGREGFSLIELMVVVGILGILAVSVGVNINSSRTRLKTFVFNTKLRFNQARFEAVKRSRDVYLEFHLNIVDGFDHSVPSDNGFTLWVDEDGDGSYDSADGDVIIEAVEFANQVSGSSKPGPEIYCASCAFPTGGPEDPSGGPEGKTISDGVQADDVKNRFRFSPNGDSTNGTAYFYFPSGPATAKTVSSGPWAITVNNVGRIKVAEWRSTSGWQVD